VPEWPRSSPPEGFDTAPRAAQPRRSPSRESALFRFVHTADLHLDSPLRSLALRDPGLSELVGTATRTALSRIVDLCLSEQVDALLIAGDLYDGDQTSMKTAVFLARELRRLDAAGIRTFVVRGNHDAEARITRELVLPAHVFGGKAGIVELDLPGATVAIHGLSFSERVAPENPLPRFRPPKPGAINVGMLHTSLGGAPGHDRYAPCSLAELQATGFDYWALGHIHVRSEYPGRPHVVMPGIPQGRDIGEVGETSVTLAAIRADGAVTTERRSVAVARFERVPVAAGGVTDWRELVARLQAALRTARRDLAGENLILRPAIEGPTPLAARARRDADALAGEARSVAEELGSVWIDRVEIAATAPGGPSGGPVGELAALTGPATPVPPEVMARAMEAREALLKALPPALRESLAALPVEALIREGAADVIAHLASPGEDG
jgi:DNA repair exonuclease SbcCD nuclease subunit